MKQLAVLKHSTNLFLIFLLQFDFDIVLRHEIQIVPHAKMDHITV